MPRGKEWRASDGTRARAEAKILASLAKGRTHIRDIAHDADASVEMVRYYLKGMAGVSRVQVRDGDRRWRWSYTMTERAVR